MATTATATATDDSLEEMELPGMDLAKLEDLCPLPPTVKQEPTEAADSPTAPAASSIPTQTSNSASTSAGVAAAAAAANTGIQPVAVLSATTPLLAPPIAAAVAAVPSSSSAITPQNNTASIGNNKSKKKKVPCATTTGISAANALASSAAGGAAGSLGNQGENTGRWTAEEHRLFLQGLEQHGKGWKKIASLIKSRTVVQIRTHAQKYFQKLAKARQNGDDEHAVTFMEGRGGGGPSSITSASTILVAPRRRRQITGTKRKVIQSIVASAHRQGKKATTTTKTAGLESLSTTTAADNTTVLPTSMGVPNPFAVSISPLLSYFVLPSSTSNEGGTEENISPGSISNAALEDSLFRFLTPCPPGDGTDQPVNEVARQAGANPITLPSDTNHVVSTIAGGEISPTGVNYLSIYPPWTDAKEAPSWYAKGGDVDGILDVADTLDWLADTGDLNETYEAAPDEDSNSLPDMGDDGNDDDDDGQDDDDASDADDGFFVKPSTSVSTLPHVDSNVESMVPTLPSLFDNEASFSGLLNAGPSVCDFKSLHSGSGLLDGHLQVFDSAMDEHAFVSTILEEDNPNDSSECLAALG